MLKAGSELPEAPVYTAAESREHLQDICKESGLESFLESSFDADAYTATVITTRAVEETLSKLVQGIKSLDAELHSQVVSRHEDLLQQASGIHKLESVLSTINARVMALQSSVSRIMSRIDEPHKRMQTKLRQLERIQYACDILRRTIRFLYVLKRLRDQVQLGDRHIPKAAQSLADLEEVLTDGDGLSGVYVVDAERAWVEEQRVLVVKKANHMLNTGLKSQNQGDISTALQVFYNLGTLRARSVAVLDSLKSTITSNIRDTLAAAAMGNSTTQANASGATNTRAEIWAAIDRLFDEMFNVYLQVHLLVGILEKKRDPSTYVYFIDTVRKDPKENLLQLFWVNVTASFIREVNNQTRDSSSLAFFFESEVPRLLGLCNTLHTRMLTLQPAQEDMLTEGLKRFENVYLSRSAARLADNVNMMFGGSSVPSRDAVLQLCRSISGEIQVTALNHKFLLSMANKVASVTALFCRKCEQLLGGSGSFMWQFQSIAPPAHIQQIEVINILHLFINTLTTVITTKIPEGTEAEKLLKKTLANSHNQLNDLLTGLFSAASSNIVGKIALLHFQDYTLEGVSGKGRQETSSYIGETAQIIKSLYSHYLARLTPALSTPWCLILCDKVTELFVRHVSLVRKLSDGGKLRLAGDMATFENALTPLLERTGKRLNELGAAYVQLRNVRAMLFLETDKLDLSSMVVQKLNPIVLLHHLFTRAPETMPSPHTLMQCSVVQYAQWMDGRPDREVLGVIQGSVDTYTNACMKRGDKEFSPVYPFMVALLRKEAVQHTQVDAK